MSDDPDRPEGDDFDARLRAARRRHGLDHARDEEADAVGRGLGLGMRIAVEIVAALIVGGVLGFLLDRWLGSSPWLLLLGLLLGAGAAVLNVYRAVRGIGYAAGYTRPGRSDDRRGG